MGFDGNVPGTGARVFRRRHKSDRAEREGSVFAYVQCVLDFLHQLHDPAGTGRVRSRARPDGGDAEVATETGPARTRIRCRGWLSRWHAGITSDGGGPISVQWQSAASAKQASVSVLVPCKLFWFTFSAFLCDLFYHTRRTFVNFYPRHTHNTQWKGKRKSREDAIYRKCNNYTPMAQQVRIVVTGVR